MNGHLVGTRVWMRGCLGMQPAEPSAWQPLGKPCPRWRRQLPSRAPLTVLAAAALTAGHHQLVGAEARVDKGVHQRGRQVLACAVNGGALRLAALCLGGAGWGEHAGRHFSAWPSGRPRLRRSMPSAADRQPSQPPCGVRAARPSNNRARARQVAPNPRTDEVALVHVLRHLGLHHVQVARQRQEVLAELAVAHDLAQRLAQLVVGDGGEAVLQVEGVACLGGRVVALLGGLGVRASVGAVQGSGKACGKGAVASGAVVTTTARARPCGTPSLPARQRCSLARQQRTVPRQEVGQLLLLQRVGAAGKGGGDELRTGQEVFRRRRRSGEAQHATTPTPAPQKPRPLCASPAGDPTAPPLVRRRPHPRPPPRPAPPPHSLMRSATRSASWCLPILV